MTQITPISIKVHSSGFCCQYRTPTPSIQTIMEGVQAIQHILAKDILCKHDIEDINYLYKALDNLERRIDYIPEYNSQTILKMIIEKVDKIVRFKLISAKEWIYFYYLQNFSDPQLELKKQFTILSNQVVKKPHKEMAVLLPFCISKDQFDQDVKALIGDSPTNDIADILNRKRAKLSDHATLIETIKIKEQDLGHLRQKEPHKYPSYLGELLNCGYIHLYDHLLYMKTLPGRIACREAVKKISFSQLSHIILQTREAILQKVLTSIPANKKNILFLLGGSGAGKSTTLCFLRGDKMALKGFQYESQQDQNQLISGAGAVSCTFLPTIEIVNDLVLVDFPGFDDSNGPLVSLGMEYALKALLSHYSPKLLVIESITNTQGRLSAAGQLGSRLNRLIENKKDGFLGLTKYSEEPHFGKIKQIEEDQKNALLKPSPQEIALQAQIQGFSGLMASQPQFSSVLQPQISDLQQQLSKLQQEKASQQQLSLPDTDAKKECRAKLEEKETDLLTQIGLGKIIRFFNLEDPTYLISCLATLSDIKNQAVRVNSLSQLDPDDEKLLEHRFDNNLKQEIENRKDCYVEVKESKKLEQKILESSLINAMLSETNPEICQLLHLPETDSRIVRSFDKKIVKDCIKNIIISLLKEISFSLIKKIEEEFQGKVDGEKINTLKKKRERLLNFVLGILGSLPEGSTTAEAAWDSIQQEHKTETDAFAKSFELPTGLAVLLCIPLGIPYGIRELYKYNEIKKKTQKTLEDLIEKSCLDLDQMYNALVGLKDVEKLIDKQEQIDEAIKSQKLSLKSKNDLLSSIVSKIDKVKDAYGITDWDKRIEVLKEEYPLWQQQVSTLNYDRYLAILSVLADDEISYRPLPVVNVGKLYMNLAKHLTLDSFFISDQYIMFYKPVSNIIGTSIITTLADDKIADSSKISGPIGLSMELGFRIGLMIMGISGGTGRVVIGPSIEESIEPITTPLLRVMLADVLRSLWDQRSSSSSTAKSPTKIVNSTSQ